MVSIIYKKKLNTFAWYDDGYFENIRQNMREIQQKEIPSHNILKRSSYCATIILLNITWIHNATLQ